METALIEVIAAAVSAMSRDFSSRKAPMPDRRASPQDKGTVASLRRLKGLLARPMRLENQDGRLQLIVVERRRKRFGDDARDMRELCAELTDRLLAREDHQVLHVLRHLSCVHGVLRRQGWAGVSKLPAHVLGRALIQAEMLDSKEPSPLLVALIDRLKGFKAAADGRAQRPVARAPVPVPSQSMEISESTFEEFQAMERSWTGTMPAALMQRELGE